MDCGRAQNNPNFPSELDIKPSTATGVYSSAHIGTPDERFNALAQEKAIREFGIAGRVWEASYAILAYLDPLVDDDGKLEFDPPPFTTATRSEGLTVIELGSGTGLVASRLVRHLVPGRDTIVVTDLPDVCTLLARNLCGLSSDSVLVRPMAWGDRDHALRLASDLGLGTASAVQAGAGHPTHIICSDLVYFPALLAPLLRTLLLLTAPPFAPLGGAPAQLVISYKIRSLPKEAPFWSAFGLWFEFEPVFARPKSRSDADGPWSRFIPVPEEDEMFVFVATRRPESLTWALPEHDQDLLAGVGAWGTPTGKADDKFEALLLLNIGISDNQ
ncbi:hypothetical protein OBBRIDRAFT_820134 [Obba rivulosa]|uniref:Methyltransferase-domain-containing protein n=1 Tax=Obba rivulosa TaxID=1052685 RepID=A0A8E2APM5_9APHY|nr:hypothetical protein OBBRIDRAFT_820134 [Obba rivulosa]